MDHRLAARGMLALFCVVQGAATVAVDCNRTHATNPAWTPHARFHVVWQALTMALLAGVEMVLIWGGYVDETRGFYGALALAAVGTVAFLLTAAVRSWFGGGMHDANGYQPLRVTLGQRVLTVDLNLVAEILAVVALVGVVLVFRW